MLGQKLSALHDLLDDQLKEIDKRKPSLTCFQELKDMEEESLHWKEEDTAGGKWVKMPFLHHMVPDIQFKWDLSDFDPARPNDVPDINLAVLGLVLATNIEISEGTHAWSRIKYSLERLGFTNFMHHYFEKEEKVNHPAMAFARSAETVKGKYVVAAVYRGSMSYRDFISDMGAETDGFYNAGIHSTEELRAYCSSQKLTKENTILFITGHSYGASCASLVGINSTDMAERDSVFCYTFASPNYIRKGLTGEGMKMFSFNSSEDIIPQVPIGIDFGKEGINIGLDRLDIESEHPDQYARFLNLYRHFRDRDFDVDYDYLPASYVFNPFVKRPANDPVIRNHTAYFYMSLLLCSLPDEEAYSYMVDLPKQKDDENQWNMYVGEAYKLPLTGTDQFTWVSSDETVAAINEKGIMAGKSAGDARLTVTGPNGKQQVIKVHISDL